MSERAKVTAKTAETKKGNSVSQKRKTAFSQSLNSPVDRILFLQRTIGNSSVQRLFKSGVIQTKLKIGQPNDIYEQEADRVAEQVMRMPEPKVQRQAQEEEEKELIQTKPLAEQITPLVQRQVEEEEEEELQAKEISGQTPDLEARINAIRGGGQPLLASTRTFFEPRFGADFGQVRLHTGAQAAESARVANAKAFTTGKDVVFGAGQYSPETSSGKRLLAHELTHIVQQDKVPSNNKTDLCHQSIHIQREERRPGISRPPPPLHQIPFESDRRALQDYLEDLSRESQRSRPNEDVLRDLRELVRLRVERIIQSLEEYVRQGLRLDDIEMALKELPWPPQLEGERDRVIRTIRQMRQGTP